MYYEEERETVETTDYNNGYENVEETTETREEVVETPFGEEVVEERETVETDNYGYGREREVVTETEVVEERGW